MNAKIKSAISVLGRWIEWLGIPALILALLIAGLVVTAQEFFAPIPLTAAIAKDLQKSNEVASGPNDPTVESAVHN